MIFALISTIVSVIFAAVVLNLYRTRHHGYTLAWGVALMMWVLAAAVEVVAASSGWTVGLYRIYYLFGGILLVGCFGLGTSLLLFARGGKVYLVLLAIATLAALWAVGTAPIDGRLLAHVTSVPPDAAMCGNLAHCPATSNLVATILAIVVNTIGTIFLVGGAIYSAVVFAIRKSQPRRVVSNVLIGIGALVVASAATLTRFGQPDLFYLGQAMGLVVMFAGFVVASLPQVATRQASALSTN